MVEEKEAILTIHPSSGPDGTETLILVRDAHPGESIEVRFGDRQVDDVVDASGEYRVRSIFHGCDGDFFPVEVYLGEGEGARVISTEFSITGSPYLELTAEDYYLQGVELYDQGDYDGALIKLTHALDLDPFYAVAYFQCGLVYDGLSEMNLALSNYEIFLMYYTLDDEKSAFARGRIGALRPADEEVQSYVDKGFLNYNEGELDIALINFSEALKIEPEFAMAYYGRGLVYDAMGEADFAISDYKHFLALYALTDEYSAYAGERLEELRGD
jgi:tetratricopeptide (TPR) repeat protein